MTGFRNSLLFLPSEFECHARMNCSLELCQLIRTQCILSLDL